MVQLLWKIVWQLLKKLKIEFQYDPANPISEYIHKIESKILERDFYTHVHNSIIHNSYNMEARQVSVHWQMNGKTECDNTYNGILFSLKKEGNSPICHNIDKH